MPRATAQEGAICGGEIVNGGEIAYPAILNSAPCSFGTCYLDNQECTWNLACSNNLVPQVQFTAFHTELGWDFVRALDEREFELWSRSGDLSEGLETVVYTQSQGLLRFTSDGSVIRPGFSAVVTCETGPCTICPAGNQCVASGGDPEISALTLQECRIQGREQECLTQLEAQTTLSCTTCPPGRADLDGNGHTPCDLCGVGDYAAPGSLACTSCSSLGQLDDDADPATPCLNPEDACQQICPAGMWDDDCDESTDCVQCAAGAYASGGRYPAAQCQPCEPGWTDDDLESATPCVECLAGFYAQAGYSGVCISCPSGRFAPTPGGGNLRACAECQSGQFAGVGSSACAFCSSGTVDEDFDASTPCTECSAGTYAGCGETDCDECGIGQADTDSNAATPCVTCESGRFWESGTAGSIASCIDCPAGRAGISADTSTACVECSVGEYAAAGSSSCTTCLSLGQFDDDRNPSTPCSDTDICLQVCAAGTQDDDCSETSACAPCSTGAFAVGGVFPESRCEECVAGRTDDDLDPATPCVECLAGLYAEAGNGGVCISCASGRFAPTAGGTSSSACDECQSGQFSALASPSCTFCASGRADEDSDASTACTECSVGTYAGCGETECNECVAGQVDSDGNSATPCTACDAGKYWEAGSLGSMSSCIQCSAGFADLDGASITACVECSVGEYAAAGSSSCTTCLSLGQFDDDRNPSTPCSDTDICLQVCAAGTQDDDCSETSACAPCSTGAFAVGGVFPESRCEECVAGRTDDDLDPATPCVECLAGLYAEAGNGGVCISCASGRFAPTAGGTSSSACDECQSGQFSALASPSCTFCASGRADEDSDASTACTECSVGTYAGCGETECNECVAGQVDSDGNSATPCTACDAGKYWEAGSLGSMSSCIQCSAGFADLDGASITACVECSVGEYAPVGAVLCASCGADGRTDHDLDPATPCAAVGTCSQSCPVGTADADCDASTPCTPCDPGSYSPGGVLQADSYCTACPPGTFAPELSQVQDCAACPAGQADSDFNSWTACVQCQPGQYAADASQTFAMNATQCLSCPRGTVDSDSDPATDCERCSGGRYNEMQGATALDSCKDCSAGRWSPTPGKATCDACPETTYRGAEDIGCIPCGDLMGSWCGELNLTSPKAAAGYYSEEMENGTMHISRCIPPRGCLGMCSADALATIVAELDEGGLLDGGMLDESATCDGGLGFESCTLGYVGRRCSQCKPYEPGQVRYALSQSSSSNCGHS